MSDAAANRREFLGHASRLIGGISLLGLAACGEGGATGNPTAAAGAQKPLKGVTLTFASAGGAYQDAQESAWCKPFAAATGATVRLDGPSYDDAKVKVQVESGNVYWDVIDRALWWANAHKDWLEPVDTSIVDTGRLAPEFKAQVTDVAVPNLLYSAIQMYDDKFAASPPRSWADFFDVEKYPGKRGFPTYAALAPMEIALLASGTAPADLYPMDVDKALAKLEPLKKHLLFYDTFAASSQQLESKQVALTLISSGRGYDAVKNGAKFGAQWNQSFTYLTCSLALKGGKNKKAAMEFIDFTLSPEAQAPIPELISYGTVNPLAKPTLNALQTAYLPTTREHIDQAIIASTTWWAENYAEAFKKYAEWQIG